MRHRDTGEPLVVGDIEKMSKSKKNVVAPEDMVETYGVDAARLFVMSDSPPERDVQWTTGGIEGAGRFVQRVWAEFESQPAEVAQAIPDETLRRATHKLIKAVTESIEGFRFNSGIARLYEFLNVLKEFKAEGASPAILAARAEALSAFARLIAPFTPHLAEECWRKVRGEGMAVDAPWPPFDPALAEDTEVVLPVQINGKKKGDLTIARDADQAAVEQAALALDFVQKALEGRPPRKVIVVPQRIVNVVA